MNLIVHQSITIQHLSVDSIADASILQIGCAGTMKSISQLFNTGGYTGPAPKPGEPALPIVPLASIE